MTNKRFILKEDANPNYLATICRIGEITPIPNADRVVKTVVNGYDIVVSKDYKEGDIVVYFPVECAIGEKFLSKNNLFERSEFERNANADEVKALITEAESISDDNVEAKQEILNKAKAKCGFFNKSGRVRIIKIRGQYSMGFVAGVESLVAYDDTLADADWEALVGTQFNYIDNDEFCWKYVPPVKEVRSGGGVGKTEWQKRMNKLKKFDRIIPGQFAFHYDTKMLAEHIGELRPDDKVSITVKLHGTSTIHANVLVNKQLTSWWDKAKKVLGLRVKDTEYGRVYSSRKTIKSQEINPNANSFYETDIWGCVERDFGPYIDKGLTVYGEIVGYQEGIDKFIQPQHDYGCKKGEWKFMPYRITETVETPRHLSVWEKIKRFFGFAVEEVIYDKVEWNIDQVDKWTRDLVAAHPELEPKVMYLTILYYGRLGDLYPDIAEDADWHKNLLARMKADKTKFLMEEDEPLCKNKVPREGIVIRLVDDRLARAWKLKTMRHYGKEAEQHDKGEVDIEEMA